VNLSALVLFGGVVLLVGVAVTAFIVWTARWPGITLNQRRRG
jgi:hypothetical protein